MKRFRISFMSLGSTVADKEGAENMLYRETALRFDEIFADTTCDATRTLIKAIILIRSHGLFHRIWNPNYFITAMNKLSIEMTHARKKKDSKKVRKQVLRKMKKLMKLVESHAENYRQLLTTYWNETDLSENEARVILDRMEHILKQLPAAVNQAHERIIGRGESLTKIKS